MTIPEKLKAKWDKKLRDSGFEDIENADGSLKTEGHARTLDNARTDNREEYYRQARTFLNSHKFVGLKEYAVWFEHCNGASFRSIADQYNLTFYRVRSIVVKYQKLSGLRK